MNKVGILVLVVHEAKHPHHRVPQSFSCHRVIFCLNLPWYCSYWLQSSLHNDTDKTAQKCVLKTAKFILIHPHTNSHTQLFSQKLWVMTSYSRMFQADCSCLQHCRLKAQTQQTDSSRSPLLRLSQWDSLWYTKEIFPVAFLFPSKTETCTN